MNTSLTNQSIFLVFVVLTFPPLREKCQNTEFFVVCIFLYLDWMQENTDQKKLSIWTLFTHCTRLLITSIHLPTCNFYLLICTTSVSIFLSISSTYSAIFIVTVRIKYGGKESSMPYWKILKFKYQVFIGVFNAVGKNINSSTLRTPWMLKVNFLYVSQEFFQNSQLLPFYTVRLSLVSW